MSGSLLVVAVVPGLLFVLIVLAGIATAAWEVRQERRAGVPVTRPAWEQRAARRHVRETQGRMPYLRGLVKGLRA